MRSRSQKARKDTVLLCVGREVSNKERVMRVPVSDNGSNEQRKEGKEREDARDCPRRKEKKGGSSSKTSDGVDEGKKERSKNGLCLCHRGRSWRRVRGRRLGGSVNTPCFPVHSTICL